MAGLLRRLRVRNFRSLAEVDLALPPLTVMFGPCGVGKTSLLDTLWFVRDCLSHGVDHAASRRDHGVGLLWDGAEPGASIVIAVETSSLAYAIEFGLSAGRIDSRPGERIHWLRTDERWLDRPLGAAHAIIDASESELRLRDPSRLALDRYADLVARPEIDALVGLLASVRSYSSRAFHLHSLKKSGSETDQDTTLEPFARNLWSVLRNIKDRRSRDPRYDTIHRFMTMAFPAGFTDLIFEQTGPTTVYASMIEQGRSQPIHASGVSDGHLQMLIILTALFGDLPDPRVLIFDEPDISLHPWPLAVMGEAVREATTNWQRQVILATHSPVLISQFDPQQLLVADKLDGTTTTRWLAEIPDVQDLLDEYAAGSIYMGQAIAPQGGKAQFLHPDAS